MLLIGQINIASLLVSHITDLSLLIINLLIMNSLSVIIVLIAPWINELFDYSYEYGNVFILFQNRGRKTWNFASFSICWYLQVWFIIFNFWLTVHSLFSSFYSGHFEMHQNSHLAVIFFGKGKLVYIRLHNQPLIECNY